MQDEGPSVGVRVWAPLTREDPPSTTRGVLLSTDAGRAPCTAGYGPSEEWVGK